MNINSGIAKTYILSNRKLTAVGILGVLLGMSVYIFMNSLLVGFDKSSNKSIFRVNSHITVYKDDEISKELPKEKDKFFLIVNPTVVPNQNTIENPQLVMKTISQHADVVEVSPQVMSSVFYNNGRTQIPGNAFGVVPAEANRMYHIESFMVEGDFNRLASNPNGIIIGSGIAEKMNVFLNDNINITSSKGVNRTFKVMGIFKTNNSAVDKSKSYVNIAASQQMLKEGTAYITEIHVNVKDQEKAEDIAAQLSKITGYKAEGWKSANETFMAANKMRKIIITFVSLTILLIAGFGIYNILNMTVSQKINDIAILKAMGFKGKDVIRIFVTQAVSIGAIGVVGGVLMSTLMITLLKKVYLGGDIGYFPIDYEPTKYAQGIFIGLFITFFAGYIPAKKASKVDPVEIFRK
ncbi:MAG: ABC transporter permease [Flavobacteriales bacterium]